ncbi:MAG: hypothetical protein FJ388_25990 [Verrucomicrobia bacterium]|nr:hypothetical protein [Verrucomicrobiota bacterium]
MGELLGVRVNKVERAECFERFTTDPLNGASRGQFWKLFFIPAENHVYRLEPVAPDARVLGQYEDHRGQTTGAATVITQNKEGGRAAVFAYDGFESVVSAARRAQLLAVADWISRGRLPVWIETPAQVMAVPRMTGEGKLRSVFLLNAGMDRSPALRLRLRAVSGATARWQTPPGSRSTVPLRKQSHDVIAEIPALAPWSVGCLLLQPGTV